MVARLGIALYWLIAAVAAVVALGAAYVFFREGFIYSLPVAAAAAVWLVGRAILFALARR
jgi:hypothetical protein